MREKKGKSRWLKLFSLFAVLGFAYLTGCSLATSGKDGTDGKDGVNGLDGSQFYSGTTDISVLTYGKDGDYYLDTDNYILYKKANDSWHIIIEDFGKPASSPTITIDSDGYWVINGVKTETKAQGQDGRTQTVSIVNGYWCIDGVSTNVSAEAIDGTPGADGATWIVGSECPQTANSGDMFLDTGTCDIYKFEGSAWVACGNISGDNGATWYSGVESLEQLNSDDAGKSGDFYLNTSNYDIYKNENGIWKTLGNIKGQDVDESRIEEMEDKLNNGKIDIERLSNYKNTIIYDKQNIITESNAWLENCYVSVDNGQISNGNPVYIASETYIPVESGSTYVLFGNKKPLRMIHYVFYDIAKTVVSGGKSYMSSPVFTVPEGVEYLRTSLMVTDLGYESFDDIVSGAYTFELYKQSTSVYSEPKAIAEICGLDADTTIIDGSITAEKTDFFNKYDSPNLLDNYVQGYYVDTKYDQLTANISYCVLEKLPVTPGYVLEVYSDAKAVSMRFVTAFDSEGLIISTTGVDGKNQNTTLYEVPYNCYYVTITISDKYYTDYEKGDSKLQVQCTKESGFLGKFYEPGVPIYQLKQEYYVEYEYEFPLHCYLPSELCVADNTTIELYYSQICLEHEDYNFQWVADFGRAYEWKFQIKGNKSFNGKTKKLVLNICDDDLNVKFTATCNVKFVSSDITVDQLIIPIGDSLTNSKAWLGEVNNLSNGSIKFRGTQGTTSKSDTTTMSHEGRSGATARWYNNGDSVYTFNPTNTTLNVGTDTSSKPYTSNPFWNPDTDSFDFDYYCNSKTDGGAGYFCDGDNNEISITPTGVQIYLGTNGISLDSTYAVGQIKLLIENIQKSEKGKNIPIYVVNTLFRPTQIYTTNSDGFTTNTAGEHSFLANMKVMNLEIALYEALSSNNNVIFVPVASTHDSEHNFPYEMENINPRNDKEQYKVYTDTVHPTESGYFQMADIMFSTIAGHCSDYNTVE